MTKPTKFGRWTFLCEETARSPSGAIKWLCRCDCGKEAVRYARSIQSGDSLSCGCAPRITDLTGLVFGSLTVLGRAESYRVSGGQLLVKWHCRCVCGKETTVLSGNLKKKGHTTSCGCAHSTMMRARIGEASPQWKGGETRTRQGYVRVSGGPHTSKFKHHLVMEEMLGRPLEPGETVHHKNGIKDDNRPENLELWASNHPSGQRVEDLVVWAEELLRRYAPEKLK